MFACPGKVEANKIARSNFVADLSGDAVGLLGPLDGMFYLECGFEQEQIKVVEKERSPNLVSLRADFLDAGFDLDKIIFEHDDVFNYLTRVPDRSISALFLDLFGWAPLLPKTYNGVDTSIIELIASKLSDTFHFQHTYAQHGEGFWEKRSLRDRMKYGSNPYEAVHGVMSEVLAPRGLSLTPPVFVPYMGDKSKMYTSSFAGTPA